MLLSEIQSQLPKEVAESASLRGISKLTPPQELAVKPACSRGTTS